MLPERNTRISAWLATLALVTISLTGCTATGGASANGLQAAADVLRALVHDFLRQLLQAAAL